MNADERMQETEGLYSGVGNLGWHLVCIALEGKL